MFAFLGGWFSRNQRAKWSFQVVTSLLYWINLHNSSRKLFSEEIFVQRHLLCMQQFHSISHNSGRNVYPCEFEIPVCIINTCVLWERIKHEIALCKGIQPWIPDSRCWIPLFVSRAWILDPNRLCPLDSLNFPIPVTKIIPDSGFQNQKFSGLCYPPQNIPFLHPLGRYGYFLEWYIPEFRFSYMGRKSRNKYAVIIDQTYGQDCCIQLFRERLSEKVHATIP